jgi:hypothetical protein
MELNPPQDSERFFIWLKSESERYWKKAKIHPMIYGFQIQKRTKWNPPLNVAQIQEYENELGFGFPEIYRTFLKHMNGTDKPAVNVYGKSGVPYEYAPAYYSFPRDLKNVKGMIEWICESFKIEASDIDGERIPFILPIVSHRFLIADSAGKNPMLSMHGDDVIAYASSLETFLVNDIFRNHMREENLPYISVDFWLE